MRRTLAAVLSLTLAASAPAGQALAWGQTGHRMIGETAAAALPKDLPPFLTSKAAIADIGELSREPDRLRSVSKLFDSDTAPAHFLDLDDDGKVLGGPVLGALPPLRQQYDTQLRTAGADSWKAGYLPYSITESWQKLQFDFAYWRMAVAGAKTVKDKAHKAWLVAAAKRYEALLLSDMGFLSHYVGDGSQPLHVTVHFNGWGDYPNPDGFTTDKIHSPFESAFVVANIKGPDVAAAIPAFHDCGCPIEKRVADYLAVTGAEVKPLYQLWKDGGFKDGDPRGKAFAVARLAAGAAELRDLTVLAWTGSSNVAIGYPKPIALSDVVSGKVDPYPVLHGAD
jgi:hypothetical protein